MFVKFLVEWVSAQSATIAQDDEFHSGAGHGYVHASQIAQKSYVAMFVSSHKANYDYIALLPLKGIYGVHRY